MIVGGEQGGSVPAGQEGDVGMDSGLGRVVGVIAGSGYCPTAVTHSPFPTPTNDCGNHSLEKAPG